MIANEATHLIRVVEIQSMPVDDRATAKNFSLTDLEVVEIELVRRLESLRRRTSGWKPLAGRGPLVVGAHGHAREPGSRGATDCGR